jgi:hypothetical protein
MQDFYRNVALRGARKCMKSRPLASGEANFFCCHIPPPKEFPPCKKRLIFGESTRINQGGIMLRHLKKSIINIRNQAWKFWLKEKFQQNGVVVDEQFLTFITSNGTDPVKYESEENRAEKILDRYKFVVHWW